MIRVMARPFPGDPDSGPIGAAGRVDGTYQLVGLGLRSLKSR